MHWEPKHYDITTLDLVIADILLVTRHTNHVPLLHGKILAAL
jgi:hypothetical protein